MAEVELKNISKIYEDGKVAVKDATFKINDKEFMVLVGPSGCGKTTTLRMIAGLEEITEGDLLIDSVRVNDVSPKDRNIAMVFQNYALYPHMTVFENMAFGLKLRKVNIKEINKRVLEAADILGIKELLDKKPKALSGGQRQRVAVGRAIVRNPKVFLFDEPLSNLDAKLRVQMRTEISKLHNSLGATMVYVTHDQTEAMTMGDRIVIMKDGVIHQIDTPLNLYYKPKNKFVAGFIGSPSMNFIPGTVIKSENAIRFVSSNKELIFDIPSEYNSSVSRKINEKLWLGIRPEDINSGEDNSHFSHFDLIKTLEVVEPMGNEVYLYFSIEGIQFVARVKTDKMLKAGNPFKLYFNTEKIYFFDYESQEALY